MKHDDGAIAGMLGMVFLQIQVPGVQLPAILFSKDTVKNLLWELLLMTWSQELPSCTSPGR